MKIQSLLTFIPFVSAGTHPGAGSAASPHWKPAGSNDCNYQASDRLKHTNMASSRSMSYDEYARKPWIPSTWWQEHHQRNPYWRSTRCSELQLLAFLLDVWHGCCRQSETQRDILHAVCPTRIRSSQWSLPKQQFTPKAPILTSRNSETISTATTFWSMMPAWGNALPLSVSSILTSPQPNRRLLRKQPHLQRNHLQRDESILDLRDSHTRHAGQ